MAPITLTAAQDSSARPAKTSVLPVKYWLPLVVAIFVTGAILAVSELSYRGFLASRGELARSMAVQSRLMELQKTVVEADSARRAYLLTRRVEHLEPFQGSVTQLRKQREQLRDLVAEDKALRERLADLNDLITLQFAKLQRTIEQASGGDFEGAIADFESQESRTLSQKIESQAATLARQADLETGIRARTWTDTLEASRSAILAVAAVNATLILLLALVLIRDTRRARESAATHASFADRMKREVAQRTTQLSSLSEFLQTQTEQEKARLARELHDELGSILTPARMDVSWLEGRIGADPEVGKRLERLSELLDSGIDLKRRIIENLRPSLLDHLGLPAALRWHVEETCKAAGIDCTLTLDEGFERLTPELEIALYRIVQESVANIVRHAKARNVDVSLSRSSEGINVSIRDDGIGMADLEAAERSSFGIGGMRQRLSAVGGTLTMSSSPGHGTQVLAFVPRERSVPVTG